MQKQKESDIILTESYLPQQSFILNLGLIKSHDWLRFFICKLEIIIRVILCTHLNPSIKVM